MTTANTCSRLGTCSEEVWTICAASGSGSEAITGDSVSASSTAVSDSEDLGRKWNVGEEEEEEEEERESLWEERERKLRLVLLEKDGFCFEEILQ